jgi:hypothetical protein
MALKWCFSPAHVIPLMTTLYWDMVYHDTIRVSIKGFMHGSK